MAMKSSCLVLLLLAAQTFLFAQEGKENVKNTQEVAIPGTQEVRLKSNFVPDQEYLLQINLPRNHKDSTRKFPVIYLLDSQWDFPLLSAIIGELYFDGFMPEVILVGITWGGKDPKHDLLRARDFTPTTAGQPEKYGNAQNFLNAITKELAPFIESKFRADKTNRTLMGSSFGGLFTLYTMFKETNYFKNYVLTSPYTPFDSEVIYKFENEYAAKNKGLDARLYMAFGDLEHVAAFDKLRSTIQKRNYANLKMETKVLENTGHSGTKPEGYTRGLQWAFKKPIFRVDPATLKSFTGTYAMGSDTAKVVLEKEELYVISRNFKTKLAASGPRDFYAPGTFMFMHFEQEQKEKIRGFRLEFYGGETFVNKIQ